MKKFANNSDLFLALKAHNQFAHKALFDEIYPGLCNCALKIVKDKEQARDIAIDRFRKCLALIEEMVDYDHLINNLFAATINLSLNYVRDESKWNKRRTDPILLEEAPDHTTTNEITRNDVVTFIKKQIAGYNQTNKKVAYYALIEGWTTKDIANELNIGKKNVQNRRTRILKKVRDALRKAGFRILF